MIPDVDAALSDVLGHARWRPGQAEAARAFAGGRDVQLLLATGAGKSACFQAPAIARARAGLGPTLVVSPLIALMRDQVDGLRRRGVAAVAFHTGLPTAELAQARRAAPNAALIYASPERLAGASFRRWLRGLGLSDGCRTRRRGKRCRCRPV